MHTKAKSFVLGIISGLIGHPFQVETIKPTEPYLYGRKAKEDETPDHIIDGVGYIGKVFPKLPEWDKETYPYAVVTDGRFRVSKYPFFCWVDVYDDTRVVRPDVTEHYGKEYLLDWFYDPLEGDTEWVYYGEAYQTNTNMKPVYYTSEDIHYRVGDVVADDIAYTPIEPVPYHE